VVAALGVGATPLPARGACESGYLRADDGAAGDDFGASVAVSGNRAVVGAPEDDDAGSSSGAAYVFAHDGSSWHQQQRLTASDAESGDDYGFAVAISGDTIVVGAPRDDTAAGSRAGSAYVYTFDGSTWGSEVHLFASDAGADDRFGYSVAIDGDSILVGAIQWDGALSNAGAGYVFTGGGMSWSEQDKLVAAAPSGTNPHLGHSASLDGNVAVLGAWQDAPAGMSLVGAAHVFRRDGLRWTEEQKLAASDAADFRWFGQAVSVSGNVIAVGAYGDRADDLSESGGAYFFTFNGVSWDELNNVNASDAEADDRFGWSIAVDGDDAVIGTGTLASKAYLFHREVLDWSQRGTLNSSDPEVSGEYAYSVALAGGTAVIGDRAGGAAGQGVAFVFDLLDLDCLCPWDCQAEPDGTVSVTDFLAMLGQWGQAGTSCDLDGGGVSVTDFLALLAHWGPCP
jgi:hypothetical protein